ncbi:MAG: hypothetical protein HOB40_04180 [Candidatus Marinimicrobia bacterium]|jgi:hypothetical protein|nr:hypothetical protein [Candidatus Neomarinimicrobiota bacterium]MBT7556815.1 hypothetical protein [Candidatus Woesearchaeota archaeon]MBT3839900.1 hypothetical protein [Candidatus Neomarinimicrobiota bacterium]MBT3998486.1 hypothetical protein [Candidatus Neomarinimicrobiota bacterium]MBT4957566.1 hypothetical protein [Candidatus Neomarinimicrobiota bacterium]
MRYFSLFLILSLGISQKADWIMFPHELHVFDEEIECNECHENVLSSMSLNERLLPTMDTCESCHEDVSEDDEGDCTLCHANADELDTYPELASRRGPDFAHRSHISRTEDCLVCHTNLLDDDKEDIPNSWVFSDCKSCHENSIPENHSFDWVQSHGLNSTVIGQDNCNLCHQEQMCESCHSFLSIEPTVHPGNYYMTHGIDAKMNLMDCTSCHEGLENCSSCHQQTKVMPMNHNLSNWIGQFLKGGGLHGYDALDNPGLCQVCHQGSADPTCARCHPG